MTTPIRRALLLASVAALAWLALAWPLLPVGASDLRVVDAFQPDEIAHIDLLRTAIATHSMAIGSGPYGHLVYYLALIPLKIRNLWRPVGDLEILRVLRVVSVLFGAAMPFFMVFWAALELSLAGVVATALLLLTSSMWLEWSTMSHPDGAQAFLLAVALFGARRLLDGFSTRWLVLASATAGLAFSTKYAGVFALPIIFVAAMRHAADEPRSGVVLRVARGALLAAGIVLLAVSWWAEPSRVVGALTLDGTANIPGGQDTIAGLRLAVAGLGATCLLAALPGALWRRLAEQAHVATALRRGAVMVTVFVATFVATSPYKLPKAAFIKELYFEGRRQARATLSTSARDWVPVAGAALGPILLSVVPIAWVMRWWRPAGRRADTTLAVLTVWIAIYAVLAWTRMRLPEARYAIPFLPALAWVGGYAIDRFGVVHKSVSWVGVAAIAMFAVPGFSEARAVLATRDTASPLVAAGRWLACAAPAESRVAYDHMSYVPPSLTATVTWEGTLRWREQIGADIVMVRAEFVPQRQAPPPGTDPQLSPIEYYRCLDEGSCGMSEVFRNELVRIYAAPAAAAVIRARGPSCGGGR